MSVRPPAWARGVAEALVTGAEREFVLGDLEQMYAARAAEVGGGRATVAYLSWAVRAGSRSIAAELAAGFAGDVRQAMRQLRRAPRAHLSGALVLSVGLGVAGFSWGIYYAEHVRTPEVDGGDRLVEIGLFDRATGALRPALAVADLERLGSRTGLFESLALTGGTAVQLVDGAGAPDRVDAVMASPGMFGILEMRPALGRLFVADDGLAGAERVAVLGHGLWSGRYGASPDVVGSTIRVNGEPTTIVGVLPEGARYLGADPLWLPITDGPGRDALDWTGVAKLAAGVTEARARAELESLSSGVAEAEPGLRASVEYALLPFGYGLRGPHVSTKLRVLSWVGGLLFLMAVANVANLFLVRARLGARELGVRRALGAGTARILRQLSVEAAVPATLGLVGGLALAAYGLEWYRGAAIVYGGGTPGPSWVHYGLEAPHVAVLAAGAVASTVLVTLLTAAWELGRPGTARLRSARSTHGRFALGKVLLTVEIAAGGALLLLATLLVTGAWNLRMVDYGFDTTPILTGTVELESGYPDAPAWTRFYERLEAELAADPRVESVALGTQLPMIRYRGLHRIEVEGYAWDGSDVRGLPLRYADFISRDFFRTFGREVARGRAFTSTDVSGGEAVAIVNEPFSERYLNGADPIGARVRIWRGEEPGPWRRVVGVAPHLWMDTDVNAIPEGIYVPLAQAPRPWAQIGVRTRGDAAAFGPVLREIVAGIDPDLPVLDVRTMPELIRTRTRSYRFQSPPFVAVGLAALFLALGGLYAIVSYLSSLRLREFGIRASMGAARGTLVRLCVAGVVTPTVVGVSIGALLGMHLVRGFDRWLFLVDPWSPGSIGVSVVVLAIGAFSAALAPALRASRVDLVKVLEAE